MERKGVNSMKDNRRSLSGRLVGGGISLLLAGSMLIYSGCGSAGFLGLQDYQRDLLFGIGSLAFGLLSPGNEGLQGPPGPPGEPGPISPAGQPGQPCWDLDGENFCDPEEDRNEDGVCDILDCQGEAGSPGPAGQNGEVGPPGDDGQAGVNCWDDDGDGVNDPSEDANGDGVFNVADCQGPQGSPGAPGGGGGSGQPGSAGQDGLNCWDLNGNHVNDPAEDVNADGQFSALDCQGPAGSTLFDTYIDRFFTFGPDPNEGALDVPGPVIVRIVEPALGEPCSISSGVQALAYRVAISQHYTAGNPVTMRLYLWRVGPAPVADDCFIFRLDAFRARHATGISAYGSERYIRPDVMQTVNPNGTLLVIDLPLNNTTSSGLGLPNDLAVADLLAFELNGLGYQDGACYTLLGVDFFESQGIAFLINALVFTTDNGDLCSAISPVECTTNAECDDGDPGTIDQCVNEECVNTVIGCGNPVAGGCCSANATPFCNDADCCSLVCAEDQDPFCCEDVWDEVCANEAAELCAVCAPPQGACCQADGSCTVGTQAACTTAGGTYQGDDSDCTPNPCPQPEPTGACCNGETCTEGTEAACTAAGGTYQGDDTDCASAKCGPPPGVCGDPASGDCCQESQSGEPGCNNAACCEAVCLVDPYCCGQEAGAGYWDDICADEAADICGICGPGGPPANDNCANSVPILDGDTDFDTTNATTDGAAHQGCMFDGQTFNDIWFDYTATCTGDLTVSTCDQAFYDTDLVVYDNCQCPLATANVLDCSDDAEGCDNFTSEVTVPATQGNCYKVRVGGWDETEKGAGTVTITCAP